MKKLIVLMLLLLNTACANNNLEFRLFKKHDSIHEEFKPYVKEFITISDGKVTKKDFKRLTMGFRDFSKDVNTVGICHPIAFEIDISRKWWKKTTSSMERLGLIFHEFGHCILKRGHTKKPTSKNFLTWLEKIGFNIGIFTEKRKLSDGCPASIMHPQVFRKYCIDNNFIHYLDELFNRDDLVEEKMISQKSSSRKACKKPIVFNKTKTWNKRDQGTINRAKKTCVTKYRSCLKVFFKNEELSYAAICGE